MSGKVLIVATSATKLLDGRDTGCWVEEVASPYLIWREKGLQVTSHATGLLMAMPQALHFVGIEPVDPCRRSTSHRSLKGPFTGMRPAPLATSLQQKQRLSWETVRSSSRLKIAAAHSMQLR
jgi:hypothetical protein